METRIWVKDKYKVGPAWQQYLGVQPRGISPTLLFTRTERQAEVTNTVLPPENQPASFPHRCPPRNLLSAHDVTTVETGPCFIRPSRTMGNATSTIHFTNVTQVVETRGGLLQDTSTFENMTTYGPLNLTFSTVWVVGTEDDTPIGPYEITSPVTHYENLSGRWSGAWGVFRLVVLCAAAFCLRILLGSRTEKG